MSRSGYTDECDGSDLAMWRGVVASATRGKRGQRFFRDLAAALDAMPVKRLIANDLEQEPDGPVCALGALARFKGLDLGALSLSLDDDGNAAPLASAFNIAEQLAQETMFVNDEAGRRGETDEQRWTRVRAWAARQISVTPEELAKLRALLAEGCQVEHIRPERDETWEAWEMCNHCGCDIGDCDADGKCWGARVRALATPTSEETPR